MKVVDGLIKGPNSVGITAFASGQFGYTGSVVQPPVTVPSNPGIQFAPPPAFSSSSGPKIDTSQQSKPKTVDCEVRSAPKRTLRTTSDSDADGNLSAWVRLPEASTLGADALNVNGFTPKSYTASVTFGVTVRDATTATAI